LSRGDLNEEEWRLLEPFLPPKQGRRSRLDDRQIVNGILWHIRAGAPWHEMPEKFGKWMTVYQRFRRWTEEGVWEAIAASLTRATAQHSRHGQDWTTIQRHVSAIAAHGNALLAVRAAVAAEISYGRR
jgi:transposase